jgi:hypothetical protein
MCLACPGFDPQNRRKEGRKEGTEGKEERMLRKEERKKETKIIKSISRLG